MARIKGRTREQTHASALNAAARVFAEFGFEGTTLSRIASLAGVTPATLCHHFGSKQGLYDAVVDTIYKDILGLAQHLQGDQSFAQLIHHIYGYLAVRRDSLRLLMRNIVDSGGVTPRVREVHMGPLLANVSKLLAARFQVELRAARRAVVAMTHLIMRFITNSDEDNRIAFGLESDADTRVEIEATLVSVGEHLLGFSTPRTTH